MKTVIAIALTLFTICMPSYASKVTPISKNPPASAIQKININQADEKTLTGSFKGIGKKRAQAIIAYRKSHEGFKSLEELAEVKGFGQKFIDRNREKLKEVFVL